MISKIKKYFILIVLGIYSLILFIIGRKQGNQLDKEGVFVLGKIYYRNVTNRGTVYKYNFYFQNKMYPGGLTAVGWRRKVDELIYVMIVPSNPDIGEAIDIRVPSCFTLNLAPRNGWNVLPEDTCK